MILAFLLSCLASCEPACAKGQTCAAIESCDVNACVVRYECEGVPDDCRTNGCPASDDLECRPTGNEYACVARECLARPGWCADCRCAEWARGRDGCCYEWRWEP